MGTTSYPETLNEVIDSIGAAGRRLNDIDAVEAGAGNISAAFNWDVDVEEIFPSHRDIDLPWPVPALAGYTVLVTGSGCRLRQLGENPKANLGAVVVHEGGLTGTLNYKKKGNFDKPTSEFNSHLAVHQDQIRSRGIGFHAVIHAQPPHLTLLSHIEDYQDTVALNRRILRWEPETIVQLREGVGYLPFMIPGSQELMAANVAGLRDHQIVLWAKGHEVAFWGFWFCPLWGPVNRGVTVSVYEYMNLCSGGRAQGLTDEELSRVVRAFNVDTTLF